MKINRKLFLLLPIFVIVLVAVRPVDATPTAHTELVLQVEEEILHLDSRPRTRSSLYDSAVQYQIYGYLGLIAPGETIVTLPGVAESWTAAADGLSYNFTLRPGLTFHDGSALTAVDIEYSFKAARVAYPSIDNTSDPAFETDYWNFTYASDDALEFTVASNTQLPDAMFEFDFCGQWNLYALVPEGSFDTEQQQTDFDRMPVSCGPYYLADEDDWAAEDYIKLTRFDDWFGWGMSLLGSDGNTYTFPDVEDAFETIKFRIIPEKAMALVELRTYGVDVTTGRFSDIASLEATKAAAGFDAYTLPVLGGAAMKIQEEGDWPTFYEGPGNFPNTEVWFRRALSHAIDRTNIVDNVYLGVADERTEVFSDWILDKFPSLDTSDYYDAGTNVTLAEELLDNAGYTALGFSQEPDNRFGWGYYKNETTVNSVTQTKGYHFTLTTMDCDFCVKRVLAIKKDLADIGIYIDAELLEFGSYLDKINGGTEGYAYNTSYIAGGTPDPDFIGPQYDFSVGGFGGNYETPWDFIAYKSFAYWYFYGYGGYSWLNEDYEIGYAKASGGEPGFGYLGIVDPDMPVDGYPVPIWSDSDAQFIEGCEQAGKAIADEVPEVPLVWYVDTYAFNDKLINFLGARNSMYHCAYAYWGEAAVTTTTGVTTTTSELPEQTTQGTTPGFEFILIFAAFSIGILLFGRKQK
jgi:ABC-type transport system substrate-binding protein